MAGKGTLTLAAIALACSGAVEAGTAPHITTFACTRCAEWNAPQKPFNIYGNTWYVGVHGLSVLLITSPKGHILLDGGLPQSAPLIEKNIKALGFKMRDVKLILNSHAHFDHAGGIGALQRASGATVIASAAGARTLEAGEMGSDDPQYEPDHHPRIDKLAHVQSVGEGETVTVGALSVTAHMTPGHAPGGAAWTWTSCEQGRCLNMVYAESLSTISADHFRFTDAPARVASVRAAIDKVASLPCDIVVSTHPEFTDTFEKLASKTATSNPFIDSNGCRAYADEARKNFEARLNKEKQ